MGFSALVTSPSTPLDKKKKGCGIIYVRKQDVVIIVLSIINSNFQTEYVYVNSTNMTEKIDMQVSLIKPLQCLVVYRVTDSQAYEKAGNIWISA